MQLAMLNFPPSIMFVLLTAFPRRKEDLIESLRSIQSGGQWLSHIPGMHEVGEHRLMPPPSGRSGRHCRMGDGLAPKRLVVRTYLEMTGRQVYD